MKKITMSLVLMAGLAIVFVFVCTQKDARAPHNVPEEIEQLGIAHNQVLDDVLNDLRSFKSQLFIEKGQVSLTPTRSQSEMDEIENFAYQAGMQSINNIDPRISIEEFTQEFPKDRMVAFVNKIKKGDYSEVESNMTEFELKYFRKILKLSQKEKHSIENFIKGLGAIEEEIIRKAPSKEVSDQMLAMTTIARHSAEYWNKNAKKWRSAINTNLVKIIEPAEYSQLTRSGPDIAPGFYPVQGDPRLFIYVDENGVIYLLECAAGTLYNPTICVCDHPSNVDAVSDEKKDEDGNINWDKIFTADLAGGNYGVGWWKLATAAAASLIGGLF